MGYLIKRLREDDRHLGWFDFVRSEGDLTQSDLEAHDRHGALLRDLETTELTKCFKMVALEALLEAGALRVGMPVRELATRSHQLMQRSPELYADVPEEFRARDLGDLEKKWEAYWRKNPIDAWTATKASGRTWFQLKGTRFVPAFEIEEKDEASLTEMVRELVDYRLAQYRARHRRDDQSSETFTCSVTRSKTDPRLELPSRAIANLPEGEIDVRVEGEMWTFRFAKEFCSVAHRAGNPRNQLPDLLRRWFGPNAGTRATRFEVRFERSPDGLWAEPVRRNVIELAERRGIVAYPDLRAAAGHATEGGDGVEPGRVLLPVAQNDPDLFAVRVSGTSMDGGKAPMRDGDWAIMRLARSAPAPAMQDRVVLVQLPASLGNQYQIKRLRKHDGQWRLTSDNPAGPNFEATDETVAIARLETLIHPEDLAPPVGSLLSEGELPKAFGLPSLFPESGRQHGHLFICIDRKGMLLRPDLVRYSIEPMRPGETAFVHSLRPDGSLRYVGVGRWMNSESCWQVPEVDLGTWRSWGSGRSVSRQMPDGALRRAQVVADALFLLEPDEAWLQQGNGIRARILGRAPQGGLRIDGGEGGFEERTVSLNDLAWVVAASDSAREQRLPLDEALINKTRYLEGTPKSSTRYIDTPWALAAWLRGKGLVQVAAGGATPRMKLKRNKGTEVDASFSIEPVGDRLSIVVEARGGTGGSADEQNREYSEGLELLLERLQKLNIGIHDSYVESRDTDTIGVESRRLKVEQRPYPIAIDDPKVVKKGLSAAQAKVGRAPEAKGSGNSTKRIRLVLTVTNWTAAQLANALQAGEST